MVEQFYTTYIGEDLAHHDIFHFKVGKGGITSGIWQCTMCKCMLVQ